MSIGNSSPKQEKIFSRPESVGTGTSPALPVSTRFQWRCTTDSFQSRICGSSCCFKHIERLNI